MDDFSPHTRVAQPPMDGGYILRTLWLNRYIVTVAIAVPLLFVVTYLHLATERYTTSMGVTPAQESEGGGLRIPSDVAALAGFNVNQGVSQFDLYVEAMKSLPVATAVAQDEALLVSMFPNEWNGSTWLEPPRGIIGWPISVARSALGLHSPEWAPPDARRVLEYLDRHLWVNRPAEKPITTLSIEHEDPVFSGRFLAAVHEATDEFLRARSLARTTAMINYLQEQLRHTTERDYREALILALREQTKLRMSAGVADSAFAASVIEPTTTTLRPTHPRGALLLLVTFVLSATCIAGFLYFRR